MSLKEEDLVLIAQLIDERRIDQLVEKCEDVEIHLLAGNKQNFGNIPRFFYPAYLCGYLIKADLNNARFLWKRTPDFFKKSPEFQETWQIGRYMWEKQYPQVYKKIMSVSWSAKILPLYQLLAETYRRRTITLLSRAYTSISIEQFSSFCGLSKEQVEGYLKNFKGWQFDGQFIYPQPIKIEGRKKKIAGADLLKNLTEKHLFLELNN